MSKNLSTAGLIGPNGLVVAIILQAVDDLSRPKYSESARAYLQSEQFCSHLEWLDFPPTLSRLIYNHLQPGALQTPVTRC